MSRAVSRAEAAFALTIGRDFSPFLTILICFFSDIAKFRVSFESECIERISRHTVPKISKTRTSDCDHACKEEATSANARDKEKRPTSNEKIFVDDSFGVATVANRTRKNEISGTATPISIRVERFSAPCL